jgi:hypothetical protein
MKNILFARKKLLDIIINIYGSSFYYVYILFIVGWIKKLNIYILLNLFWIFINVFII